MTMATAQSRQSAQSVLILLSKKLNKMFVMKTSKTLYWSLLLIPFLLSGFGCKKFLDRKPLTATLADLHQGSLEGQSLGLYSALKSDAGFSVLPWLDFHSIRDDDAEKGSNATDGQE